MQKQRVLDLRLAGEQSIERTIPMLQLPRFDAHPRRAAGLAFRLLTPCRDEAPPTPIADKIIIEPLRQCMLAPWRRQSIGDEHQRPIAQPHRLATVRLDLLLIEDLAQRGLSQPGKAGVLLCWRAMRASMG